MISLSVLLSAVLSLPCYAQHPSPAPPLPSSSIQAIPNNDIASVSENFFRDRFVSVQECQDFRFANSVLFATCASERMGVDLNECIGNEDGFLIYKTE
jgi:hypothetical protein